MHDLNKMNADQIREELVKLQAERKKRYAYNKTYRQKHPMTEEQKAQQYANNKASRERKKALEQAIIARAAELGILS